MALAAERVLITGAGQLAGALYQALNAAGASTVAMVPHADLEITDAQQVAEAFAHFQPTLVFHTAGLTRVDFCEREPRQAELVNGQGTENIVRASEEHQARVVYFSTDYVFPGREEGDYDENEAPAPLNAYGRSKLAGEQASLAYPRALVIRTAQVFAPGGRNFLAALRAQVGEGKALIKVVADEMATPTYAPHLALAALALAEKVEQGIFHIRGPEELSYFQWAERYFGLAHQPRERLRPVSRKEIEREAARPQRAVLGMSAYFKLDLPPLPPLDEALRHYVRTEMD